MKLIEKIFGKPCEKKDTFASKFLRLIYYVFIAFYFYQLVYNFVRLLFDHTLIIAFVALIIIGTLVMHFFFKCFYPILCKANKLEIEK